MAGIAIGQGSLTALSALLPSGTSRYVALLTTLPDQSGVGLVEATGSGYARVAISAWSMASANARRQNTSAVTFGALSGALNGVVGWAIYDASTGGNLLAFGPVRASAGGVATTKSYISGDQPQFPAGELYVTVEAGS